MLFRAYTFDVKTDICSREELTSVILSLLRKYKAEKAILFGSYAREEADEASDIDLIVIGGNDFIPTDVFCIAEELHQALGKEVDVYELREIEQDSDFYRTILSEGVQIAA